MATEDSSTERQTQARQDQAASGDGVGTAAVSGPGQQDFFGHPRGLSTLFLTEFWERFSYYGMRALLVLFMTAGATAANPGLGFDTGKASAVYGLYTFFVYVLSLPGGWVADNIWGQRRAVFIGGCIIATGHLTMALPMFGLPDVAFFYLGLAFIVVGTGFLKPNISTMVGDLYPEGGARRDAGFSIFYMGINFGAILGPTLCSIVGEGYDWHWGFSLAGFGMIAGLAFYQWGARYLGDAGTLSLDEPQEKIDARARNFYLTSAAVVAGVIGFGFLMNAGMIPLSLEQVAGSLGLLAVGITVIFFAYIIFFGGHTRREQKRLGVIFWLFILAALFWSGFEQAGSSLNLFAKDLTNRAFGPYPLLEQTSPLLPVALIALPIAYVCYRVFRREDLWILGKIGVAFLSLLGLGFATYVSYNVVEQWTMPASMLQNINPTFIVILAPVFGMTWTWLAQRDANPSIPVKFGLGLLGLAAGFFVLSWGAANASAENPVSPSWLIVTYFLHTCGELCLSPVGLSSMTKLAPEDRVGQMMGIWFVAAALGNLFAGLVAGQLEVLAPSSLFWTVAMIIGGGGIVALLAAPPVQKLMGDVE
jgi:POT family proton-dependent oligopeptide transporter